MRKRPRITLHYRNFWRSLYVRMRHDERFIAHQQRWFARMRPHLDATNIASHGMVIISCMRHMDQSWRFLQPEDAK